MKILLTGATGYIGKRLLPALLDDGHHLVCCTRDKNRFDTSYYITDKISVAEVDFLDEKTLKNIPEDIDAAYYLIHSMSASLDDFDEMERKTAEHFRERMNETKVKQVIYLSGIVNEEKLSKHLSSRKNVEKILGAGSYHLTTLRAGIIVGSGSASFEIIRDLVEKLPVMIAPRWLSTKTQPLAIRNVVEFLKGVLLYEDAFDESFDIGGPEVLTYKEMLYQFAEVRNFKRRIYSVPVMSPRLSSYWLYFITSTSYKLAVNLVNSMKVETTAKENDLHKKLNIQLKTYREAVQSAFEKIEHQEVLSSWTDAQSSRKLNRGISKLVQVPVYGVFRDHRETEIHNRKKTIENVWSIGGEHGWYYANWLWGIRGFMDKAVGGVGLNRGRKNPYSISAGDSLDFWRVLYADKEEGRLLLYAEMKLPGEAWLEFNIKDNTLSQTATFRPHGLQGRMYWYSVLPFHAFLFKGMLKKLAA